MLERISGPKFHSALPLTSTIISQCRILFPDMHIAGSSPAAEEGNPALLDKVFFFTDYFSLGYVQ